MNGAKTGMTLIPTHRPIIVLTPSKQEVWMEKDVCEEDLTNLNKESMQKNIAVLLIEGIPVLKLN